MEKYIIPQAQSLKPFRQGQLDTLCALYSAINAIRIAAGSSRIPFTRYHARLMTEEGLEYLAKNKKQLLSALTEGISNKVRRALIRHLIKYVKTKWGVELEFFRPDTRMVSSARSTIIIFIEENIRAGNPVCISLNGHHNHYTVISGFNDKSFYLFDSDGLVSINRSLICMQGDMVAPRHRIKPKGVISICEVRNKGTPDKS